MSGDEVSFGIDKKRDPQVDHPDYYNTGKIEVIDAIEDWALGFNDGNCVKYVARAGKKVPPGKSPAEARRTDLKKARFYLDREIQRLEKERTKDQ